MRQLSILLLLILPFSILGCEQGRKFLTVGDSALDFSLSDLDGNTVSLKNLLKGKEIILNFWGTWCPECKKQIPHLNEFARKYKDKAEIVGIAVRGSKEKVRPIIEYGIEYKMLLDPKGKVAKLYGIFGVPTNIVINKEGLIKNLNLDIRQMESYLLSQLPTNKSVGLYLSSAAVHRRCFGFNA